jgi:ankyrin repeat protein
MTPLHLSLKKPYVFEEDDRIISGPQLLLEHGASVHAQNKSGQTALHLASQSRITRIVPLLLKLGADVDAKDNDNMTPLHFALTKAWTPYHQQDVRQSSVALAQVLLEHGASAHTRNKDGQTPLHLASRHRFSSIVALLLKLGAEVDVRDNDNTTPLLLAPKREMFHSSSLHDNDAKCGETARLLLVHGADVNMRNENGQTPLHLASERHFSTFLALLLKFGADVNAQDDDNMTPLHVALFSSPEIQHDEWEVSDDDSQAESDDIKVEVIQLLLEHGANIHMQNKKRETPFQVTAARGEQKVIQLLSEYMQNDHSMI